MQRFMAPQQRAACAAPRVSCRAARRPHPRAASAPLRAARRAAPPAAPEPPPPVDVADDVEADGDAPLESRREHLRVTDAFLPKKLADKLRGAYDAHFESPRTTRAEDFIWNYWHVPGQYTLLRTPAQDFFSAVDFSKLEAALLEYGRETLGCGAISPIWLSYYISGCRQELHADVPHGPYAFVLSLTPALRSFTGGETMLLQPHVLDYFRDFRPGAVVESAQLVDLVAPEFNRLTVFDARFPHGVRVVEGVQDPRAARVVLHGWFLEPRPFFEGALDEDAASEALNAVLDPLYAELGELHPATGVLTVRMRVRGADGRVEALQALSDSLVPHPACADLNEARAELLAAVRRHLEGAIFPPAGADTRITLPFVFE